MVQHEGPPVLLHPSRLVLVTRYDGVRVLAGVGAHLLLSDGLPDLGEADHAGGVHDAVAEGVRVVAPHPVHRPVRRLQVRHVRASEDR